MTLFILFQSLQFYANIFQRGCNLLLMQNRPVVLHFASGEQFTSASWSHTQPHRVFFSTEKGNVQVWDITKRRSEPLQEQNIAGSPINGKEIILTRYNHISFTKIKSALMLKFSIFIFIVICPYNHKSKLKEGEHYLSVADDTGVIRLMLLPKHLYMSSDQAVNF